MANSELFYALVPRVYRNRDFYLKEPLRAYLLVLQEQFDRLSANFAATYDNWFIETCSPWVIPYLAELIHGGEISLDQSASARSRALVANLIGYRRRKGTTLALERAVANYTGAPTLAVEGIEILAFTQNVRAAELDGGRLVDVERHEELLRIGTPFDRLAHTVDVRVPQPELDGEPAPGVVAALPSAVTLYLWRLPSFPMHGAQPKHLGDGRYTFDPSGLDVPLFYPPVDELSGGAALDPRSYPDPVRREVLACDLAAAQRGASPALGFDIAVSLPPGPPRCFTPIPPSRMAVADLADWDAPRIVSCADAGAQERREPAAPSVLIDPELGRFMLATELAAPTVLVAYAYAFSADIGAGPFPRSRATAPPEEDWIAFVGRFLSEEDRGREGDPRIHRFRSLTEALEAWSADEEIRSGSITIVDNCIYDLGGSPRAETPSFALPLDGRRLRIEAGSACRPLVRGVLDVDLEAEQGGELTVSGLLWEGAIRSSVQVVLSLSTTTMIPGSGVPSGDPEARASVIIPDPRDPLRPIAGTLALDRSVSGALRLSPALTRLQASWSIVDGRGGAALAGPEGGFGPRCTLERLTFFGPVRIAELLWGTDLLFADRVDVERETPGYIQFSWVPPGSRIPLAYRVYPEDRRASATPRPGPRFTSVDYGAPGYAQIALVSPPEVLNGGQLGDPLGAFSQLAMGDVAPRDRALIGEFVRVGFEAGVAFVT